MFYGGGRSLIRGASPAAMRGNMRISFKLPPVAVGHRLWNKVGKNMEPMSTPSSPPVPARSALWGSVAPDHFDVFGAEGKPNVKRIADIMNLERKEIARATRVDVKKVRLDDKLPKEVVEWFAVWGTALNLVGDFFKDNKKTALWFKTANPMLGSVSPRDMILSGRGKSLLEFIQTALAENPPE